MTPAARLSAAIDILAALKSTAEPADKVVREFFRARRYAGSKDRRAVSERVFDCLRHFYSYSWRMGGDAPRRLVIASLLAENLDPAEFFTGENYAPAALDAGESLALASPRGDAPLHVAGEFPDWLPPELRAAFGDNLIAEMQAMGERASIDIRTNTLLTNRNALTAALAAEGFTAEPAPLSATGLRLSGDTTAKLSTSQLFTAGYFEFQDDAAQYAAQLCDAKPGQRVLDYAAGAGGKTLALAAAMQNQGKLVAHDISSGRLAMLGPRATRAGVTIIETTTNPPAGLFDLVLLDAPCSGTGTWRRQPELRVRLTQERLAELTRLQAKLLKEAASFVAPGGRLAYATCSVLPCENDAQIAAFLSSQPQFTLASQPFFRASPRATKTDGFFTAILSRPC